MGTKSIWLSSNYNLDSFPQNLCSNFSNKIQRLSNILPSDDLKKDYYIALTDIYYPAKIDTISNGNNKIEILQKITKSIEKVIDISPKFYPTVDSLVQEINAKFNNKKVSMKLSIDDSQEKTIIKLTNSKYNKYGIKFSSDIANVLGFESDQMYKPTEDGLISPYHSNRFGHRSLMLIMIDQIMSNFIADDYVKIVGIVPCRNENNFSTVNHFKFESPKFYKLIDGANLDTITVKLKEQTTGNDFPFYDGNIMIAAQIKCE